MIQCLNYLEAVLTKAKQVLLLKQKILRRDDELGIHSHYLRFPQKTWFKNYPIFPCFPGHFQKHSDLQKNTFKVNSIPIEEGNVFTSFRIYSFVFIRTGHLLYS